MNSVKTHGVFAQVKKQLLAFSNTEIRLPTSRSERNTRTTILNLLHIMQLSRARRSRKATTTCTRYNSFKITVVLS